VLYRPTRVIVTAAAARDQRVQDLLRQCGADRCDAPGSDVALALDLQLFDAPRDRVVRLVRDINDAVADGASLEHVLMPRPHHVGDGEPTPASDPGGWEAGEDGAGIEVLVLDTGFVAPQPFDVSAQPADAEIVDEDGDGRRDPAAGHGTHVAGIIARIAPCATIVARRLLTSPVGECSDLDVAGALLDHGGAHLINCSFAEQSLDERAPTAIRNALARLPEATVGVAAAGNSGVSQPSWPAAFTRVIGVGAVGRPEGAAAWLQTDFSNHGDWVKCCAPGVDVVSTFLAVPDEGFDGFACWSGTSMAAPTVAGAIAALASRPGSDLAQARAKVLGGTPVGDVGALVDPAAL
jgi:subtilisin family serine protease